jgi:hypothetical protein
MHLLQPVVRAIGLGRKAKLAAQDLHGLPRSLQRARHVVDAGRPFSQGRGQHAAVARGLVATVSLSGISCWPW